jgi:hypothetical protein
VRLLSVLPFLFSISCTIAPYDQESLDADAPAVQFTGFAENPGAQVEVYAWHPDDQDFVLVGGMPANTTGLFYGGSWLYNWSVEIPMDHDPTGYWRPECDGCSRETAIFRVKEDASSFPYLVSFPKGGEACVMENVELGMDLKSAVLPCITSDYHYIRLYRPSSNQGFRI